MELRSPVVDPNRRNQRVGAAPRLRSHSPIPRAYRQNRDYSWLEPYQKHFYVLNIIGLGLTLIFLVDTLLTESRERERIDQVMADYYYDSEGVKRLKRKDLIMTREGSILPVNRDIGKLMIGLEGYQIMVYRTGILSRPFKFRVEGWDEYYPIGLPHAPLIAMSIFLGISSFMGLSQKTTIENKFGNAIMTLILMLMCYALL